MPTTGVQHNQSFSHMPVFTRPHRRKVFRNGADRPFGGCNPPVLRTVYQSVRWVLPIAACFAVCVFAQDAREIVQRAVELDQVNWLRMTDYTWVVRSRERHFDWQGRVTSESEEGWETLILDGRPYERLIERDRKPLPPAEQRKLQQKLDKAAAKLENETPDEKRRRAADYQKERRRQRAFLLEIPDAFDLRLEGDSQVDGQPVWVVSGTPKAGYRPKSRDAEALLKIRGRMWIEKTGYQWVRLEAQTMQTISFGWFLARLNPGAKLEIDQTRVNNEVWLPAREFLSGRGRIGLLKKVAEDEEITWTDYKKFHVDSKLLPGQP